MTSPLDTLKPAKTILLISYKRDGAPVATPVSVAFDGDRAFFRSYHKAWKTKRLRNNPNVEVAPSAFLGRATGAPVPARARLLGGEEAEIAARALSRRHRLLQGAVVPLAHRLMRYRTMHYELQPAQPSQGTADRRPGVTGAAALSSYSSKVDSQVKGS
jgi:PPOX class probable F420-dependent enzyme